MTEEQHLQALGDIIKKFKKKYDFIEAYLSITGIVKYNSITRMQIRCNSEFDKFTIAQVYSIEAKLYSDLRKYICKWSIQKPLIVRDAPSSNWAKNGTELVFENYIKV